MLSDHSGDVKQAIQVNFKEQFDEATRLKKSKPKEAFKLFASIVSNYKSDNDAKEYLEIYKASLIEIATAYDGEWKGIDKDKDKAYLYYKTYYKLNPFDARVKGRVETREAMINVILKTKDEKDDKKIIAELKKVLKVNSHFGASTAGDEKKKTPLMYAAHCGNKVAFKWILDNRTSKNTGGDLYLRDEDGHNSIEYAVMFQDINNKDEKSEGILRKRYILDLLVNFGSATWAAIYKYHDQYPSNYIHKLKQVEDLNRLLHIADAHENFYFISKVARYMRSDYAYAYKSKKGSYSAWAIFLMSSLERNHRRVVRYITSSRDLTKASSKKKVWYARCQPYFLKYHTKIIEELLVTTNPESINELLAYRADFKGTIFNKDSFTREMLEEAYYSKKVSLDHLILLHTMMIAKGIVIPLVSFIYTIIMTEAFKSLMQNGDLSIVSKCMQAIDDALSPEVNFIYNGDLDSGVRAISRFYYQQQENLSIKVKSFLKIEVSKILVKMLIDNIISINNIAIFLNTSPYDVDKLILDLGQAIADVKNNKQKIIDRVSQLSEQLLKEPNTPEVSLLLSKIMLMPYFKRIKVVDRVSADEKNSIVVQPAPAVVLKSSGLYPALIERTSGTAATILAENNIISSQKPADEYKLAVPEKMKKIDSLLSAQNDPKPQTEPLSLPEDSTAIRSLKTTIAPASTSDSKHIQTLISEKSRSDVDQKEAVAIVSVVDGNVQKSLLKDSDISSVAKDKDNTGETKIEVPAAAPGKNMSANLSTLFVKKKDDKVLVDEVQAWKNMLYDTLKPSFTKNENVRMKCRNLAIENLNKIAIEDSNWAVIIVRIVAQFNADACMSGLEVQQSMSI